MFLLLFLFPIYVFLCIFLISFHFSFPHTLTAAPLLTLRGKHLSSILELVNNHPNEQHQFLNPRIPPYLISQPNTNLSLLSQVSGSGRVHCFFRTLYYKNET